MMPMMDHGELPKVTCHHKVNKGIKMNKNTQELKNLLKDKAEQIKAERHNTRAAQRAGLSRDVKQAELLYMSMDYRHHHIAYCELLGTPRDRIEQPREGNEPQESTIAQIKDRYKAPEITEMEAVA
jgi:hypothetical protein